MVFGTDKLYINLLGERAYEDRNTEEILDS